MKHEVKLPEALPKVGQMIRFVVQDWHDQESISTVEATVVARMYFGGGTCGHNLTTSSPEFRDLEWHGPPEKPSDAWGEVHGQWHDGEKTWGIVLELEVIEY